MPGGQAKTGDYAETVPAAGLAIVSPLNTLCLN